MPPNNIVLNNKPSGCRNFGSLGEVRSTLELLTGGETPQLKMGEGREVSERCVKVRAV